MTVSRETKERLGLYLALLVKWNKAINLVSPLTIDEAWSRHFEDSIQISDFIPENAKIADLGSGGGFPGMVLAILRPDLEIHLIESDNRKCQFLKAVSRLPARSRGPASAKAGETKSEVHIHNERVEDILPEIQPDIITARAFKSVQEILEFAEPLLPQKPDLSFVLLKGQKAKEEVGQAQKTFNFDYQFTPSTTDSGASLVQISNVHKRA